MPKVTTWIPEYDKLPRELYGGNFTLVVNPSGQQQTDLYLFHDKRWMANSTHIVGWSREVIHTIAHNPDWLVGHAFQRSGDYYRLSGTDKMISRDQLIEWAKQAQESLSLSDVKVGQWGDESHSDWPDAISREHDIVVRHHSEKFHRVAVGDDVKFHVLRCNESNDIHNPEYPK